MQKTNLFKRYSLPLVLLLLFTNCSTTRLVPQQTDYENNVNRINYLGNRYSSKVYLLDESIFYCSYINISNDSAKFIENNTLHHISIDQLDKVIIKDNTASLFSGLWIGLCSGVLATLITAITFDCGTCHPNLTPFIIGIIAAPIGLIAGYIFTGEKEFIFNDKH